MKKILKTLLFLIIILIPISVSANSNDIYKDVPIKVVDEVEYYKLSSIASIHEISLFWNNLDRSVETSYQSKSINFNTVTNIVLIDGLKYSFGEIKLIDNNTYIPKQALSIFSNDYGKYLIGYKEENPNNNQNNKLDENIEYILLSEFAAKIKARILWDDLSSSAYLEYENNKYIFDSKSKKIYFNDFELDNIAFKYENGYTYIPSSFYESIIQSNIYYKDYGHYERVIIKSNNYKIKSNYKLDLPDRLVVDILEANKISPLFVNGRSLKNIRIVNDGNIQRLVLDVSESFVYDLKQKNTYLDITISKDKGNLPLDSNSNNNSGGNDVNKGNNEDSSSSEMKTNIDTSGKNKLIVTSQADKVFINVSSYKAYTINRISDPNRIILFIPHAYSEDIHVKPSENSKYIKSIDVNTSSDGVYIAIVLNGQNRYEIVEEAGRLILEIYTQKIINLTYNNSSQRKYIYLNGIALADQMGFVKSSVKVERTGLVNKVSFSDPSYRLTSGVLYVNDPLIEKISIERRNEEVVLSIYSKEEVSLYMNSERNTYTNINIMPLSNPYKNSLVIDAGHGGFDPGAVYDNVYEANINLGISKKVEKILTDMGYKVYMTRINNDFVGLYERAHLANQIEAKVFVSIHSNAFLNENVKGIMTLVYPNSSNIVGLNGKTLAKKIQSNLIINTKAIDMGIIDRPNLVVLKATKMPAVLVESGFMTNKEELALLQNDEYQYILANSIVKGIIETLEHN